MKKHNFSAGPCILPQEVLNQASEAILNFNYSGLSLIEISHRSNNFVNVIFYRREINVGYLRANAGYIIQLH